MNYTCHSSFESKSVVRRPNSILLSQVSSSILRNNSKSDWSSQSTKTMKIYVFEERKRTWSKWIWVKYTNSKWIFIQFIIGYKFFPRSKFQKRCVSHCRIRIFDRKIRQCLTYTARHIFSEIKNLNNHPIKSTQFF